MKSLFTRNLCSLILGSLVLVLCGKAHGASIIVDSFTQGAFTLQNPSNRSAFHPDSGYAFQSRDAEGSNTRSWTATLSPTIGTFTYSANLIFAPTDSDDFVLSYSGATKLNLLGYDAFLFSISSLTGSGALRVSINGQISGGFNTAVPSVHFTGTGDIVIPFAELFPGGSWSNDVLSMHFQIVPQSQDFAITLDEIAIIPEPGTLSLAAGAVWWITRRPGRRVLVFPA